MNRRVSTDTYPDRPPYSAPPTEICRQLPRSASRLSNHEQRLHPSMLNNHTSVLQRSSVYTTFQIDYYYCSFAIRRHCTSRASFPAPDIPVSRTSAIRRLCTHIAARRQFHMRSFPSTMKQSMNADRSIQTQETVASHGQGAKPRSSLSVVVAVMECSVTGPGCDVRILA